MKIKSYKKQEAAKGFKLSAFNFKFALVFLLSAFCFESCKKFIDVPPPTTQLVTASVFNNDGAATSALTGIYNKMFTSAESFNMEEDDGFLSDELENYSTNATTVQYYRNAMIAGTGTTFGPWNDAYSYIYQANAVISGLQATAGVSAAVKQQLTGEAYFIRAFWHFYLTNTYGAVPVALTTDYTVTERLFRTPRVQVLQQVIADLRTAHSLLSDKYVDASDTTVTSDRVRPTKAVALALMARAYEYLGDYSGQNVAYYTKADSAASAVLANPEYSLCTNLSGANSVFLANSNEAIWQLATALPSSTDTYEGNYFILIAAPSSGSGVSISTELFNAFEPGDQRKANWVGSITAGGQTYYFPYKYKNLTYVGTEYTMVLRLAEQYLIRAEAQAHGAGNGIVGALADLNAIRKRAGLPNYAGGTDKASVLTAILHERQVELFTEWGARWFDLNRTGNTTAVMSVVTPLKGGTWNSDGYQELYPIPGNDMLKNSNLTQNPGY